MAECAHYGKDGTPTPIADKVYQKIEVCLCKGVRGPSQELLEDVQVRYIIRCKRGPTFERYDISRTG